MSDEELFDKTHSISLGKPGGGGRLLNVGDIVGGTYSLKSIIGRGGMGYVFSAEHTIIEHEYALKIMAPDRVNEVNLRRFESEGRAIAALDHPNIVKVYNMGIDAGDCPYIVMDLLIGSTLAQAIRSGRRFELPAMLDIIKQTASGLGYAHAKGIVHRDVKPSNIMLVGSDAAPAVRLVDFGLAKLAREDERRQQSLTSTGEVFGSPHYMSPEQCIGTKVDERSDIYSLGCSVYEMVMKVPPYVGRNALDTVEMHTTMPVPCINGVFADAEVERKINLMISRMMAKRREDRYQSMAQIVHDVERIIENKEIGKDSVYTASSVNLPRAVIESPISRSLSNTHTEEELVKAPPTVRKPRTAILITSIIGLVGLLGFAAVHVTHGGLTETKFSKNTRGAGNSEKDVDVGAGLSSAIPGLSNEHAWPTTKNAATNEAAEFSRRLVINEPRNKEAKLAFERASSITATNRGGVKVLHFPSYPLGVLMFNLKECGEAKGDRAVPPGVHPGLLLDWGDDSGTLVNPFIFDKIDKNVFEALSITAWSIKVPDGNIADIQVPATKRILTVAAGWPRLTTLRLENFSAINGDDTILGYIDRLPHVTAFSASRKQLNLKQLSHHKFLQRLQTLGLSGVGNIDDIIDAVAGSRALIQLQIPDTSPSVQKLKNLTRCPNLHDLDVAGCKLTGAHIEAISKLPVLTTLWLGNYKPTKEDLLTLRRARSLNRVYLDKDASSPEEQSRWAAILPRLEFHKDD